jgi:hypothetical protein
MHETIRIAANWVTIALALAPMALGLCAGVVERFLLPLLIPRAEIERLAEDVMRRSPDDPEGAAFCEEQAAWFRSEGREQGKWRRVRREIRRRLASV